MRTRVDWFLDNNEILRAKTNLEVMTIDYLSGQMVRPPQSVGTEAEYNEQYVLWAGPVSIRKYLKSADGPLSDFTHLPGEDIQLTEVKVQDGLVPYPFRHGVEKWDKEQR